MSHARIKSLHAREILNSRGVPTVEVEVTTDTGIVASAKVSGGASTGQFEAHELLDGDPKRYDGKGVLEACNHVHNSILPLVRGMDITDQQAIDKKMIDGDGTPNKSHFGANAILGVSLACARAGALDTNQPLHTYLRSLYNITHDREDPLPVPMMNILNGGRHADNGLDFQEYMILPHAPTFAERLRVGTEIYHTLAHVLHEKKYSSMVGDEGGYAPSLHNNTEAFELIIEAVERSGKKPGKDITIGFDVAASEFFNKQDNTYTLRAEGSTLHPGALLEYYQRIVSQYPVELIEDGFADDSWDDWTIMQTDLGDRIRIVGDDLFVTNVERLKKGVQKQAANAIIIKVNQIGTLTETMETIIHAFANAYAPMISHRSGSTSDAFIADLAVAVRAPYIKTGAPARSERVAKYNRLLTIEDELHG